MVNGGVGSRCSRSGNSRLFGRKGKSRLSAVGESREADAARRCLWACDGERIRPFSGDRLRLFVSGSRPNCFCSTGNNCLSVSCACRNFGGGSIGLLFLGAGSFSATKECNLFASWSMQFNLSKADRLLLVVVSFDRRARR